MPYWLRWPLLVCTGLYYFVYFKAQSILQELLVNAASYGAQIKSGAYLLYLFGSVGVGDTKAMLLIAAIVAVLFGLMWMLLSRSFLNIATSTGKTERKEYRETVSRQRSVDAALLGRELAHFTASPSYMLNCGLSTFLMPVCAVTVLWKGKSLFAMLDAMFVDTAGSVPLLMCVMLCGLASMNFMAAPSISLEGKSLWLIQSLPVNPWKVFQAKILMQLLLTALPLLLVIVCTAIVYPLSPIQLFMIVLFAGSYTLVAALFGLMLGVKMPTLTWTNELMPIKQGAPVVLTMFGGMGYAVLLFAGFLLLPGWMIGFHGYMACFIGANVIVCVCEYLWLRKEGTARFAAL